MRLFTAFELPPDVCDELLRLQAELRPLPFRRWQPAKTLHLTLHFLGEVAPDRLDALDAELRDGSRDFGTFRLQLDRLGGFPSLKHPRTLWVGIGGEIERLAAFEAKLRPHVVAAGIPLESRRYSPHITLARDPQGSIPPLDLAPNPLGWTASELVLFQSTLQPGGAIHTPLERYPLG
ncbi:2'-5'-RNA ligase [compost metagenome]